MALFVLICALAGGVANRFSGSGNISWLPGRNIYYAALALTALTWANLGATMALWVFVSVLAYRIPGWYGSIDMGKNEGSLLKDMGIMYVRTLFLAPVFIYLTLLGSVYALPLLAIGAALATLSYVFGNYKLTFLKDPFVVIEFLAGVSTAGAFGLAVALDADWYYM